ncbi:MAG: hypothetical protein QM784_09900 [Polyangiaceae bacterium]
MDTRDDEVLSAYRYALPNLHLYLVAVSLARESQASDRSKPFTWKVSVGPSLAYAAPPKGDNGILYGVDGTLVWWAFWGGAGARVFDGLGGVKRRFVPYAEAGFWCFINVGGGYSFGFGRDSVLRGPHLFFGLRWPLAQVPLREKTWTLFVEPYYRPTFSSEGVLHESGLLVKVTDGVYF